jgi:hypothetical protein
MNEHKMNTDTVMGADTDMNIGTGVNMDMENGI